MCFFVFSGMLIMDCEQDEMWTWALFKEIETKVAMRDLKKITFS